MSLTEEQKSEIIDSLLQKKHTGTMVIDGEVIDFGQEIGNRNDARLLYHEPAILYWEDNETPTLDPDMVYILVEPGSLSESGYPICGSNCNYKNEGEDMIFVGVFYIQN